MPALVTSETKSPSNLISSVVSNATTQESNPPTPSAGGTTTTSPHQATNRTLSSTSITSHPKKSIADILEGVDLSKPGERERVVNEMRNLQEERKAAAERKAKDLGWPIRVESPNGSVREIADLDERGQPIYFITHNLNAAISTGAKLLQANPYSLTGSTLTIGQWDDGSPRSTHQEFEGRVTIKDGSTPKEHATHVAGTLIASGVVSTAKGMATSAKIDAYDWTSDMSEMTAAAAVTATDTNKIFISNHSYGYATGWDYVNEGTPYRVWEWYGSSSQSTSVDTDFGTYNTYARSSDTVAYSAPFYLMFRSAGNDRTDNPSNGQLVALTHGSSTVVAYDSSIHPKGDGSYRSGFETISFDALAKNVITIGSVSDAVTGSVRDTTQASVSSFSSWGPTDDGRIKPDVVSNGDNLYSSINSSDSSYGSLSGTSMSSPNAAGTAALLAQDYLRLFGVAMRSSTLKGLLIHTADDRGNPGPDYQYGWGLINAKGAVDLIRDQQAIPNKLRLKEGLITTTSNTINHNFLWDGINPIRVTLVWTDPAGIDTTSTDSRSPRLINNLDLKLVSPSGSTNLPYVMPFVGNWSSSSMSLAATNGTNNVDNVEQVYLASPSGSGTFKAVVSYQGSLSNSQQAYSLLVSGVSDTPAPLLISSLSPTNAYPGTVILDLIGTGFLSNTAIKFSQTGLPDISATNVQVITDTSLRCQALFPTNGVGAWNVISSNSPTQTSTLTNGFTVLGSIWSENFDGAVTGWSTTATTGSSSWNLTTNQFKSITKSYFASGPSSKSTTYLTSPSFSIPSDATSLQLRFWQSYNLQSQKDGGRLELSIDGGSWFAMEIANTDESFASNSYNSTINSTTSDINAKNAWSGSSGGFIETIINLNTTTKYAGHSLRIRWVLATNTGTASTGGWYIDDVVLLGNTPPINQPPTITTVAHSASISSVTESDIVYEILSGSSIPVSVGASDDSNSNLIYTWSASGPASSPPVFFTPNASNLAKDSTAYFNAIGDYLLTVFVQDIGGLQTSSSFYVRVNQTAGVVLLSPQFATISYGSSRSFTAILQDQFSNAMASQPSAFTWTTNGGGTIDSAGSFTATSVGGPFILRASWDGLSDVAEVTVNKAVATVSLANLNQTYNASGKSVSVTTFPADLNISVTYNNSPTLPLNAGSYGVEANVNEPNYQGTTSGILVVAQATQTINFNTKTIARVGDSLTLTPSASSGLLVSVASSNPSVADLFGDTLSFLAVGTATITASQAGNENYLTATPVTATIRVDEAWTSDSDGDGMSSLLEYALGGSNHTADQNLLPQATLIGSILRMTVVVRTDDENLSIQPEASTNLITGWSSENITTNPTSQEDVPQGFERRRYEFDGGANSRAFFRLSVTYHAK